ncbi:MAG TPA: hypothetical protein V6C85_27205 [Allocoleopsis sp.]
MGAKTEESELYEFSLNLEDDLETELEELSNLGTKVVLEDVCLLDFLRASQNLSLNTRVRLTEGEHTTFA